MDHWSFSIHPTIPQINAHRKCRKQCFFGGFPAFRVRWVCAL